MVPGVAVHLEDLAGLIEVVLYHGQVLAHLVARHRVALAVVAVALERAHPFGDLGGAIARHIGGFERETHARRGAQWGRQGFSM